MGTWRPCRRAVGWEAPAAANRSVARRGSQAPGRTRRFSTFHLFPAANTLPTHRECLWISTVMRGHRDHIVAGHPHVGWTSMACGGRTNFNS